MAYIIYIKVIALTSLTLLSLVTTLNYLHENHHFTKITMPSLTRKGSLVGAWATGTLCVLGGFLLGSLRVFASLRRVCPTAVDPVVFEWSSSWALVSDRKINIIVKEHKWVWVGRLCVIDYCAGLESQREVGRGKRKRRKEAWDLPSRGYRFA